MLPDAADRDPSPVGVAVATNPTLPIEIPPLTGIFIEPLSVGKLWRLLGFFGPAAVVTSLSVGAGETIMVTSLGAWAGYDLFWLLVLSVVVKGVFVMYLVGRYTAITGRPIGDRLVQLPGPRGWLLLAIIAAELLLIPMGLTAVAKPCGNLITFLQSQQFALEPDSFRIWENVWTTALLGAAGAVALLSGYLQLERQQIWICGILVGGTLLATLIVGPDLGQLLLGAVRFGYMPEPPTWAPAAAQQHYVLNLVTIFGYVGGSLSGYLAYSSWIALHGWGLNSHPDIDAIRDYARRTRSLDYLPTDATQARRLRTSLLPLRCDVGVGAFVLLVVTAAFMAAGAVVLFPRQEPPPANPFELLTKQASIWREINEMLVPVYYVLVVAALWGTLASVPEAICRMMHAFLSAIWPRFERVPFERLMRFVVVWFFVGSVFWTWTGITFDAITQIGAFMTLSVGVATITACALYFNLTLPRPYRPPLWIVVGGVISIIVLVACVAGSGVGLWRKFGP